MKFIWALAIIIFIGCGTPEHKPYFEKTAKVIKSVKARRTDNGAVEFFVHFQDGSYALVGEEKASCLHKGDTVEVITYASN